MIHLEQNNTIDCCKGVLLAQSVSCLASTVKITEHMQTVSSQLKVIKI